MKVSVMLKALAFVPVLCFSVALAQGVAGGKGGGGGSNAIAAYVFGGDEMRGDLAEDLAEAVANNLVRDGKYNHPRRGARGFFKEVDKMQARSRKALLSDNDFCRIGGDEGVQFLVIMDVAKQGARNSVWARILDLDRCRLVGAAEYTDLIRNARDVQTAAANLSRDLLKRNTNLKRSITISLGGGAITVSGPVGAPPPPPPPPPSRRSRSNEIVGYLYGDDNVKLGEDLADAVVKGLTGTRDYSAPRNSRGVRGFFQEVANLEKRLNRRGNDLTDRDFCDIGDSYEVDFVVIIDVERKGRATLTQARIIDLDRCRIIATAENKAVLTQSSVITVAEDLVDKLREKQVKGRSRL